MIKINLLELKQKALNEANEIANSIKKDFEEIGKLIGKEKANQIFFKLKFRKLRNPKNHIKECIISELNEAIGKIETYKNEDYNNKISTSIVNYLEYNNNLILIHEAYSNDEKIFYTIVINELYEKQQKHLETLDEAIQLISLMSNLDEIKSSRDYWDAVKFIKCPTA